MRKHLFLLSLIAFAGAGGCAAQASTIPGTEVPDTSVNRDIIQVVEEYRLAVERKDAGALMLMASKKYWEDGGTPTGGDDYGFDGLREVLTGRFQQARDIRYSLRYVNVYRQCSSAEPDGNEGCRAFVEVLIDASFSVTDATGQQKRPDKRDQNRLVLEWSGEKWLFLSGM